MFYNYMNVKVPELEIGILRVFGFQILTVCETKNSVVLRIFLETAADKIRPWKCCLAVTKRIFLVRYRKVGSIIEINCSCS